MHLYVYTHNTALHMCCLSTHNEPPARTHAGQITNARTHAHLAISAHAYADAHIISDMAGCLFLIMELEAGEASFFAPYLAMFPWPSNLLTSHYWSLATNTHTNTHTHTYLFPTDKCDQYSEHLL